MVPCWASQPGADWIAKLPEKSFPACVAMVKTPGQVTDDVLAQLATVATAVPAYEPTIRAAAYRAASVRSGSSRRGRSHARSERARTAAAVPRRAVPLRIEYRMGIPSVFLYGGRSGQPACRASGEMRGARCLNSGRETDGEFSRMVRSACGADAARCVAGACRNRTYQGSIEP